MEKQQADREMKKCVYGMSISQTLTEELTLSVYIIPTLNLPIILPPFSCTIDDQLMK